MKIVAQIGVAGVLQVAAPPIACACLAMLLVHDMARQGPSAMEPGAPAAAVSAAAYRALPGHERYRADKCGGDYVCDEDGPWLLSAGPAAEPVPPRPGLADAAGRAPMRPAP